MQRESSRAVRTPISDTADTHVAARIRARRIELGLSLQQVADAIGVTYEQVHKYETGQSRIMLERLWDLAQALDVPIGYFYLGLPGVGEASEPPGGPLTAGLIRSVANIKNRREQEAFCAVIRELAR